MKQAHASRFAARGRAAELSGPPWRKARVLSAREDAHLKTARKSGVDEGSVKTKSLTNKMRASLPLAGPIEVEVSEGPMKVFLTASFDAEVVSKRGPEADPDEPMKVFLRRLHPSGVVPQVGVEQRQSNHTSASVSSPPGLTQAKPWSELGPQARAGQHHLLNLSPPPGLTQVKSRINCGFSDSTSIPSSCGDETDGSSTSKQNMQLPPKKFSTVMIRGVPNGFTRDMLVKLLDAHGFAGCYGFLYLPIDFQKDVACGYAIVQLFTYSDARRLREHFQKFAGWPKCSAKLCDHFLANVDRYRNIPAQHESVPDKFKPALFNEDGDRIPFPPPTNTIRLPPTLEAALVTVRNSETIVEKVVLIDSVIPLKVGLERTGDSPRQCEHGNQCESVLSTKRPSLVSLFNASRFLQSALPSNRLSPRSLLRVLLVLAVALLVRMRRGRRFRLRAP
jgi:hypothetical protein